MPEEKPPVPPTPPSTPTTPPESGTSFDISEEYGTAAKNLPPTKVVAIGIGLIVVIAVIVSLVQRPQGSASGSIDDVTSIEMPNQNAVMAALAAVGIDMGDVGRSIFTTSRPILKRGAINLPTRRLQGLTSNATSKLSPR